MVERKEISASKFISAELMFDLIRQRWRQSHNDYQSALVDDLGCRTKHWQMLDICEKVLYSLLDRVLSGMLTSISLNEVCEEMVTIHVYRKRLLTMWLVGALQKV